MKTNSEKVRKLTASAILIALVIVFQMISLIPLGPISFTIALTVIVVGAVLYGPKTGALLGGVFGLVVTVQTATGLGGLLSLMMFQFDPVITVILCMGKGIAAGLVPGMIFAALKKAKHEKLGVVLASVSSPIVNTGIFFAGALTIFGGVLESFISQVGIASVQDLIVAGIIIPCFIPEFIINVALIPVVLRVIAIVSPKKKA
jgi:uncharacterized membrane protein